MALKDLRISLSLLKDRATRIWPEKGLTWLASKLPRRLVLACVVRAAVEASPKTGVVAPDRICYPQMHDAMVRS